MFIAYTNNCNHGSTHVINEVRKMKDFILTSSIIPVDYYCITLNVD